MSKHSCIAVWDAKDAALYFDIVWPYMPMGLYENGDIVREAGDAFPYPSSQETFLEGGYRGREDQLKSLLPFLTKDNAEDVEHYLKLAAALYQVEMGFGFEDYYLRNPTPSCAFILKQLQNFEDYTPAIRRCLDFLSLGRSSDVANDIFDTPSALREATVMWQAKPVILQLSRKAVADALIKVAAKNDIKLSNIFLPSIGDPPGDHEVTTPAFILKNIKLIDTSTVPWPVILELRRDDNARRKLRNLRLFMTTEYLDKERDEQFIREDLERRIEEYNDIAGSWGLELGKATLKTFFAAGFVGTAASVLFGDALTIGSLGGAALRLSQGWLEVASIKRERNSFENTHTTAYLIEVQDRVNMSKTA